MRLKAGLISVALLLLGLSAPASAQPTPFVAFVGQVVAEDFTSACQPPEGPSLLGEADEHFTSIFIPGELNTDPMFQQTSISVRNRFFAFAANVRTDAGINPNGELVVDAVYDGLTLDPLGKLTKRPGRVTRLTFNPAYDANTSMITVLIRMTNVSGIPGCIATFRGVFAKVNN